MPNAKRGVLIAGNWKMNFGPRETGNFFLELQALWEKAKASPAKFTQSGALRIVLFPPATSFSRAQQAAQAHSLPISIGAQNAHWAKTGAFTGELSGPMLREIGLDWVLIGHSERRQYFAESDATVRLRAQNLLEQGFNVILCIGETRAEREASRTREVLERQLDRGVPSNAVNAGGRLILAYEPVWAIGTGLTAAPAQAEEAHALIRGRLESRLGATAGQSMQILYGGSVTPENVASLLACPNVDGALVGGASLKPAAFMTLVNAGAAAAATRGR